jgi:hypothetical protein
MKFTASEFQRVSFSASRELAGLENSAFGPEFYAAYRLNQSGSWCPKKNMPEKKLDSGIRYSISR